MPYLAYVFSRRFLMAMCIFWLSNSSALGSSLSPMFLNMAPIGTSSRSTVTYTNDSPVPMPVKVNVSELILGVNGERQRTIQSSDFLVFPPQAVIPPYSKQAFRVQWRGNPSSPQAKTYEIMVAQVMAKDSRNDDSSKKTSLQLQISMAFGSIVTMQAASGAPKPVVKSSRLGRSKRGLLTIETVISNNSNQNFLMIQADSEVTVYGANKKRLWSHTYSPDETMRNFGLGIVQPYKSRRMKIPLPNFPKNLISMAKSTTLEIRPSAR